MILPDVNVLLYASRQDSPRHADYHRWLEGVVNADVPYGIAPQALASVIRISTHPRIYVQPSRSEDAIAFCQALMGPDTCFLVQRGPRHWSIFVKLCQDTRASGNLVQDAWFAALAMAHAFLSKYRSAPEQALRQSCSAGKAGSIELGGPRGGDLLKGIVELPRVKFVIKGGVLYKNELR